jgi:hypothetical protein
MATFSGNDGVVEIGANNMAEVRSFTVNQTAETIDDTVMGDAWRSHLTGLKTWDGTVECMWDDTDTNGQEALTIGTSVSLTLCPEGDTTGDYTLSGTATVTGVTQTQSYDNTVVTRSFTFQGSGALTIGTHS